MAALQCIRFPLMAVSVLALLAAMWAGLLRMGWGLSPLTVSLAGEHGPLMVAGFLGTLISLERSVALGRPWTYAPPAFAGLAVLALLFGLPAPFTLSLVVLASLGLVAVFVLILRRQPALFNGVMLIGAVAWLIGSVLELAGEPIYLVVYWWIGFLVLTVVGERLELSRLRRPSRVGEGLFLAALALFLLGLALTNIVPDPGVRVAGAGMLGLALWLLRYDIAGRNVRRGRAGLTRYIAVCMLSGYAWLGLSGVLAIVIGPKAAGPQYDAILHTVFLGFVFGMIFGHAPIILPAVLKVPLEYRARFYLPLACLEVSLLIRVAGDLLGEFRMRQWGGMLNVLTVLLFIGVIASTVVESRRSSGVWRAG